MSYQNVDYFGDFSFTTLSKQLNRIKTKQENATNIFKNNTRLQCIIQLKKKIYNCFVKYYQINDKYIYSCYSLEYRLCEEQFVITCKQKFKKNLFRSL